MTDSTSSPSLWIAIVRALRPAQWTKNGVVFAAYIFALGDAAQRVDWLESGIRALWAVAAFCALSSAVYLVNDVRDREQDRLHPIKRLRPIAAGHLSVALALVLACGLGLLGLGIGVALGGYLPHVLLAYMIIQVAYSFGLKRVALVDVFVIAAGFVLRALAGGVAIPVEISPWLLLCTMLLALFLGLCKRRHEKVVLADVSDQTRTSMQAYNEGLLDQLIAIVSSATVVCYALYTLWPDTVEKFGSAYLGFTIPFVLFGLFRYLDLVYRHERGDRPERILLTDVPLLINLALYGVTVLVVLLYG